MASGDEKVSAGRLNGITMGFELRKFRIAFIVLIAVLAAFLFFKKATRDTDLQMVLETESIAVDTNEVEMPSEITPVGDVGIGTLEMARFSTLDPKTKQVQREFGFEKLLHEEGRQWEIEKPYMNIYRPDLTCYITAAKGYIVLEADVNPPNPKDATLTGNVIAHIVPTPGSGVTESYIYLEDMTFVSETSTFSTAGPVTFVSDQAQMQGSGLELIYDQADKKLAMLRIPKLEHLRIKASQRYSMAKADGSEPSEDTKSQVDEEKADKKDSYICVLSGDVIIDAGEQFIAADRISITDIIWSGGGSDKTTEPNGTVETASVDEPVKIEDNNAVDIIISCNNGIALVPIESVGKLSKIEGFISDVNIGSAMEITKDELGRTTFGAELIEYNAATSDAVARGPSALTFYVRDIEGGDMIVPVIVTAEKETTFSPNTNKITFEGNAQCRMVRDEGELLQEHLLSAPELIVDLLDEEVVGEKAIADIRQMRAVGTDAVPARLSSIRRDENKTLGGVELKCPRFEYDAVGKVFIAYGPGVVKVDNSKIPDPGKTAGRFSMQRPCYAVIRNFDTLKYYIEKQRITAENPNQRIYIDYFPITDEGQEQVMVTAGYIQADLVQTPQGQYRLWTLLAGDGISFQDGDKLFEGGELLYDDQRDIVKARGSDVMPAYLNGVMFDGIEYDLVTGQVRDVQIRGPGFLQVGR